MATIGWTGVGAETTSVATYITDDQNYAPFIPVDHVIDKAFIYCFGGSGTGVFDFALYNSRNGGDINNSSRRVLKTGVTFAVPAVSGWVEIDVDADLTPFGGQRLSAAMVVVSGFTKVRGSPTGGVSGGRNSGGTLPDPFGPVNFVSGSSLASFYVTTKPSPVPTITDETIAAYPGQTVTLNGTKMAGTTGVTLNGVSQSSVVVNSDTSVSFMLVEGNAKYVPGHILELTTPQGTATATLDLIPNTAGGFGFVDMSNVISGNTASVAFNTTPTVDLGDQFEWQASGVTGLTVSERGLPEANSNGTFKGRFWDSTDGAWGAVETFTMENA